VDGRDFDSLTRTLGGFANRRAAFKVALGGVIAATIGAVMVEGDDAAARCGGDGIRCNRDSACCSGHCSWTVRQQGRSRVRVGTCGPFPTSTPSPTQTPTETPVPTETALPLCWNQVSYCTSDANAVAECTGFCGRADNVLGCAEGIQCCLCDNGS